MDNIFEYAARNKLRFGTRFLNVEDLWDLALSSPKSDYITLDSVAKEINSEIRKNEESFVEETSVKDKNLLISLEIVKHIITIRKQEREVILNEKKKAEEKALILKAIENKNIEEINSLSKEELVKRLNEI